MPLNPYFSNNGKYHGSASEQDILEDLIIESIKIWGNEFYYIPRETVAVDEILGEDRLSKFQNAYPIEMYFENVDSFNGQGPFLQKFGIVNEYSASLSVARKRWKELVKENNPTSVLPNRPSEGDLIYYPLTKGLFEIKFVEDKEPFFQLGKLYTWKLEVELFQYSSEKLDTGIPDIDVFEDLQSHDVDVNPDFVAPTPYGDNDQLQDEAVDFIVNKNNPLGGN